MNIERVLAVLNQVAPQLKAHCVGNMVAGDFETQLFDGGVINFVDDEKGWTLTGPVGIGYNSHIEIKNLMNENDLVTALRRSYVPQMHVYNLQHGYPISLPAEAKNFYWDFLYYATWAMFRMAEPARQHLGAAVLQFMDTHNASMKPTAHGYFSRFKMVIQ